MKAETLKELFKNFPHWEVIDTDTYKCGPVIIQLHKTEITISMDLTLDLNNAIFDPESNVLHFDEDYSVPLNINYSIS